MSEKAEFLMPVTSERCHRCQGFGYEDCSCRADGDECRQCNGEGYIDCPDCDGYGVLVAN